MLRKSSSPAGAVYLDRERRIEELRASACRLADKMPGTRRVVLFGSLVAGIPTPRSDADLLVVVDTSVHREPRDRVPEVLQALRPLPCPVDVFVLTGQELERYASDGDPLLREALSHGRDLLPPVR
jgi:predicted nucleotidyltransferase